MMPRSPSLIIATASALLGLEPDEKQRRVLAGQFVRGTGRTRVRRWDAAFVHHLGFWSHFDQRSGRSSWPLPATTSCGELARFASRERVLSAEPPLAGELFLLWGPRRRAFVRTGIVIAVEPPETRLDGSLHYECHTIEGNLTGTGRLDGDRMGRVSRYLSPAAGDRTIRWADVEIREPLTRQKTTAALRRYGQAEDVNQADIAAARDRAIEIARAA